MVRLFSREQPKICSDIRNSVGSTWVSPVFRLVELFTIPPPGSNCSPGVAYLSQTESMFTRLTFTENLRNADHTVRREQHDEGFLDLTNFTTFHVMESNSPILSP